ncbi:hypothetical protein I4U23_026431 [Adineta vaga]|nr:hypothetical protein I4U23_026431 [Adineta vaga]
MENSKSSSTKTAQQMGAVSKETRIRCHPKNQKIENVLLVWLDSNIDNNNEDCQNTMKHLRRIVNDLNIYTNGDQCIQFIETIETCKVCMIISGSLGQHIVPQVHNLSPIDSIFIFCGNKKQHEEWTKEWPKIKGVFTEIKHICEALKQAAQQCEQNAVSISFVPSSKNLNQLDPTFINDKDLPLCFAQSAATNPDLVGILFKMEIDPKQSTAAFASIRELSAIPDEDEVLFSMHSVFRIQDIKQMGENNKLFEVSLTLTSDNDKELNALSQHIREESFPHAEGWYRLGLVLTKLGQNEKAEEIYEMLLNPTAEENTKASIYNQLGWIKDDQGKYEEAIRFCACTITLKNDAIIKSNRGNHDHLEGYHRQLDARVRTNPDLWTWINEAKSLEESIMCRYEQEQAQKRTTRPRKGKYIQDDNKLMMGKKKYIQDSDFVFYQKFLRSVSHRYIDILKNTKDNSDEE